MLSKAGPNGFGFFRADCAKTDLTCTHAKIDFPADSFHPEAPVTGVEPLVDSAFGFCLQR